MPLSNAQRERRRSEQQEQSTRAYKHGYARGYETATRDAVAWLRNAVKNEKSQHLQWAYATLEFAAVGMERREHVGAGDAT